MLRAVFVLRKISRSVAVGLLRTFNVIATHFLFTVFLFCFRDHLLEREKEGMVVLVLRICYCSKLLQRSMFQYSY